MPVGMIRWVNVDMLGTIIEIKKLDLSPAFLLRNRQFFNSVKFL